MKNVYHLFFFLHLTRFDNVWRLIYSILSMFISVIIEPGGLDSGKMMVDILSRYGFQKIQRSCWESLKLNETELSALKKDLDRVTDYYDKIRIYQFPLNGLFVITEMKQKKWRKCCFNGTARPKN